jgi:hypothetical protein
VNAAAIGSLSDIDRVVTGFAGTTIRIDVDGIDYV